MRLIRSMVGIVFLQCLSPAVLADAGIAATLGEARRLLDAGKASVAADVLERRLLDFAGNPDFDYLLGLALYQAGQLGAAQFALERVLMTKPDHVDARLKLGQIAVERGDGKYANEVLKPLVEERLAPDKRKVLAETRQKAASATTRDGLSVRGYVLGGIGWDDNVTGGPNYTTLLIPGLGPRPTSLGSAAQASDRSVVGEAGVSVSKALAEGTWFIGSAMLRRGDNRTRDDVKEGIDNLDLGLVQRGGDELFGVGVSGQNYRVAGVVYRRLASVRASWTHPFGEQSRLATYANHSEFDYPAHAIDNAGRNVVGVNLETSADGGGLDYQLGAYGGKETANDPTKPHFSFRLAGLQAGMKLRADERLSFAVGGVYERRNHLSQDALYRFMRSDRQLSLGLSADYILAKNWHVLPQYTTTRNNTTATLYEYERKAFILQLRWDFDNESK
jgi:hypothetical protein